MHMGPAAELHAAGVWTMQSQPSSWVDPWGPLPLVLAVLTRPALLRFRLVDRMTEKVSSATLSSCNYKHEILGITRPACIWICPISPKSQDNILATDLIVFEESPNLFPWHWITIYSKMISRGKLKDTLSRDPFDSSEDKNRNNWANILWKVGTICIIVWGPVDISEGKVQRRKAYYQGHVPVRRPNCWLSDPGPSEARQEWRWNVKP